MQFLKDFWHMPFILAVIFGWLITVAAFFTPELLLSEEHIWIWLKMVAAGPVAHIVWVMAATIATRKGWF